MPRTWGPWTEIKLEAIEKYVSAFTVASKRAGRTLYLDLFAGRPENAGADENVFAGSTVRAAHVDPPFSKIVATELSRAAAEELREALASVAPGRATVLQGDCNQVMPHFLRTLPDEYRWAATFALLDQYSAEVRWETVKALSTFKNPKARTKVELLMYFGGSFMVRGLYGPQGRINAAYAGRLDALYGDLRWRQILAAQEDGELDGTAVQYELVNLMRWQLEEELGYGTTLPLTVRNTRGRGIFSMIFATDNAAGERIMRQLFEGAEARLDVMVKSRTIDRKVARELARGDAALFSADDSVWDVGTGVAYEPIAPPERPWEYDRIWDLDLR